MEAVDPDDVLSPMLALVVEKCVVGAPGLDGDRFLTGAALNLRRWRVRLGFFVECYSNRPTTIDALWPPKPKELLMATRMRMSRGLLGT